MERRGQPQGWPVAVFAHNEARHILACLDSLERAAAGQPLSVHVLANGCRDATAEVARKHARRGGDIRVVEIALGDKANAWNTYIHDLAPRAPIHFFIDGDVRADPHALPRMAETLLASPRHNAISAMPGNGRDRAGIRRRMLRFGRVAGNLYALSGAFVEQLKAAERRMPVGFIGEDWLVACMAKQDYTRLAMQTPNQGLVFNPEATFSIRSLSPWRPRDWRTYVRRLVRYRLREHQYRMLLDHWEATGLPDCPASVAELCTQAAVLPRYGWWGWRTTLFDLLAVWQIRHDARRAGSR